MVQMILHIGLPKTATTTIQHVLETAKPELARQGVLYPLTTRQQIRLVERAQSRKILGSTGPGSLDEAMGWVADEARQMKARKIVFSCERMSLIGPGALARLHDAMRAHLPEFDETQVLVYVRDPVRWATSLCQQRLKMGTARLADFLADPWPLSLQDMLSKYVARFGRDAVAVRHMHPDHLRNGSVVEDFLAATGLSFLPVQGPDLILNKALTLHGVQVADVLARHLPRRRRPGLRKALLRQLLQAIDGPRFVLPRDTQERIIAASRRDVAYLRATWGVDLVSTVTDPPVGLDLPEEAVLERALAVVAEIERMEAGADEADAADETGEDGDGT